MAKTTFLKVVTALLLAFLGSALAATPAFADDGQPPAEPPPILTPSDEAPAEPAPTGPALPPQEQAVSFAEVVADLEQGTAAVLLVDQGQASLIATSDDGQTILTTSDPIWCPASVGTPVSGASGCSASFTSLQDLIAFLTANQPSVDGVIWVEKTYDSSVNDPGVTAFTLDGATLTTMANYRLTIRGGWNGIGTNTIDQTDPSEINATLNILNWRNDVTLSDLHITAAPGPGANLRVSTSHRITLTRVNVSGNTGGGALLSNTAGTSDVLVSQSRFENNSNGTGLVAESRGTIVIVSLVASGNNNGSGTKLYNETAPTAKNVSLASGVMEFNDNYYDGLYVRSKGAISLKDITAVGNGSSGTFLDNTYGTAAVNLSGVNIFAENGWQGLVILSNGAITVSKLVANANNDWGASLFNNTATSAQPVTLTGFVEAKGNAGGLTVLSKGAITIANLNASYNTLLDGAYLFNSDPGFSSNVTLTGAVTANQNGTMGLSILSTGAISLSNVTANENGGTGAYLHNGFAPSPKPVTLSGKNSFNGNGAGLFVLSKGTISVSNLSANGNYHGLGIYIDNRFSGTAAPQNVTLSGSVGASNNREDGLRVFSYGAITVANLTADGNGGNGAYLDNADATSPRPVTLTGTVSTSRNSFSGLDVRSKGAITVANLTADGNGGYGAYLHNGHTGASAAVTISGTSSFGSNGYDGLLVYSRGNITLQDFNAYGNGGYGAYLFNAFSGTAGNVTVGTSRANWCNGVWHNYYSGLQVYSNGAVTLSNICGGGNGDPTDPDPYGYGIYVDNSTAASPKPVTLKGSNSSWGNYSGGLVIFSRGPITASGLDFGGSLNGRGAYLNNTGSGAASPQNVTLTGYNWFYHNNGSGLVIRTYGAITVANLSADWNGGYGADLHNGHTGASAAVTISGTSWFGSNGYDGLLVYSRGNITLQDFDAYGNGGYGAYLFNAFSGTAGNVTVGTSRANWCNGVWHNYYSGLEVYSNGAVTLSNICGGGNGNLTDPDPYGYGIYVDNSTAASPKPVTLKGSNSSWGNYSGGLVIFSRGPITASGLDFGGSLNGRGAYLNNTFNGAASPQNVTLTGYNSFYHNNGIGLEIHTYGAITVNNLDASNNAMNGAYLDNYQAGTAILPRSVTLNGTNVSDGNGWTGLYVVSLGPIKANNLTARWNGVNGAYLDNQVGSSAVGGVTVTGTSRFEGNGWTGLWIYSHGAIALNNISATSNGGDGACLDTWGWTTPQKVTLTGTNTFLGNGDDVAHTGSGLVVFADGQIAISNLTASNNAADGAYLNNWDYAWMGTTPGIALTGTSTFLENYRHGLAFDSVGLVSLTKVTSDRNGDSGIYGSTQGNILVACASLTDNGFFGWWLRTDAVVTLKGVFAYGNGHFNGWYDGSGTLIIIRGC